MCVRLMQQKRVYSHSNWRDNLQLRCEHNFASKVIHVAYNIKVIFHIKQK
jgi:hypothetical protein